MKSALRFTSARLPPAELLRLHLLARGLSFVRELQFAKPRRWRADYALPASAPTVLVEVEGGVWTQGRHVRGKGFEADCEKYNEAALHGFLLIRVTPGHIESGKALTWIEQALACVAQRRK